MNLLTKRIPTIVGMLLIVGVVLFGYYYLSGQRSQVAKEIIPQKVRITNVADNKFSVSWTTENSTRGAIEYGVVGDKITTKVMDDRDVGSEANYQVHHVSVEGLQPSKAYAFRILSGEKLTRFDNNGSPYTTTTGPVIGATPASVNFYGNVQLPSKQTPAGSIVYLTLPGSTTASTLVNEAGNYAITLSTIRSDDLRSYAKYDPSATIGSVSVESGALQSSVAVSLANSAPVPTITLGQNAEFMNPAITPAVAEVAAPASPTPAPAQAPTILNVEPLVSQPNVSVVNNTTVTLINPLEEGEVLKTLRPEFRGTGPSGTTLSIALTGQKSISDTVVIASDGTWSWAPVIDLKAGKQTITLSYTAPGGAKQKLARGFSVSNSTTAGIEPAFVATPSASTTTGASAAPSATPREAMPATDGGVPVTGVIENTLLTGALGIVIMVIGAALLVL